MRNASLVLKTEPTLCILRMLSNTTHTEIFSEDLNSSAEIRPNSLLASFLMGFWGKNVRYDQSQSYNFTLAKMAKTKVKKETPLMAQYRQIKAKHPQAILLFRVGDFYETFGQDAITASNVLGIVLTKRANGSASEIELAGFPHHSIDTYLPKLVKAGHRVAICDQLEDPKLTKKIVKRGVTELVTPGVAVGDHILDNRENNYLAALHFGMDSTGLALIDISTGEFVVTQGSLSHIENTLQSFKPSEVIFSRPLQKKFIEQFGDRFYTFGVDDWVFQEDYTKEILLQHFNTNSLKGFGVHEQHDALIAAGAALHYLGETEHKKLDHIQRIWKLDHDEFVWLDRFTTQNLELTFSPHPQAKTLLDILDRTITPMGGRMMRRWVQLPLKQIEQIQERHETVAELIKDVDLFDALLKQIKEIGDLERILSKVVMKKIQPREILQMKRALEAIEPIKSALSQNSAKPLQAL